MSYHKPLHTFALLLTLTVFGTGMAMEVIARVYDKDLLFKRLEEFANLDPKTCIHSKADRLYHACQRPMSDILDNNTNAECAKWKFTPQDRERLQSLNTQIQGRHNEYQRYQNMLFIQDLKLQVFPTIFGLLAGMGVSQLYPMFDRECQNTFAGGVAGMVLALSLVRLIKNDAWNKLEDATESSFDRCEMMDYQNRIRDDLTELVEKLEAPREKN